jgi:hypothetical protein
MTETEALAVLKLLGAAYPTQRQRMTNDDVRGMAAAYMAGLLDLDRDRVRAAVDRLVKSSQWIPTIAEIRAAAVDVAHGTRAPGGEAWGRCLALIRRYGSHRWPAVDFEIDDPVLLATIRALGWLDLCASDNAAADRARFIELYDQLAKGERKEAAIAPGATSRALPQARPREQAATLELPAARQALEPTSESVPHVIAGDLAGEAELAESMRALGYTRGGSD